MNSNLQIPQGEETILIEMTVKEAMALSGEKFHSNHQVETEAVKKVKKSLEDRLLTRFS
ncbi:MULTISPECIES: hypothetical protein [Paenibacillus]|uniref:hypothetical protein n=1 Tax=Paenibacillus TaxID=44249 RepID=UPI000AE8F921|nr:MULTISPECIES: hypothetical protein [Paenibacillus]